MHKLEKDQLSCPDHGTAWVTENGKGLVCCHNDHQDIDIQQKPERKLVSVKSKVERLCWEELESFFIVKEKDKNINSAKLAIGTLAVLQKEIQFEQNIKQLSIK